MLRVISLSSRPISKITDAQQKPWDQFADALRMNAKAQSAVSSEMMSGMMSRAAKKMPPVARLEQKRNSRLRSSCRSRISPAQIWYSTQTTKIGGSFGRPEDAPRARHREQSARAVASQDTLEEPRRGARFSDRHQHRDLRSLAAAAARTAGRGAAPVARAH